MIDAQPGEVASPCVAHVLVLDAALDARDAARLALWYSHAGWLLVPRGWRPTKGGVGADGSVVLLFLPDTGQGHVSYYDPSACVGCAQHVASAFFAEARQDARANEFPFYTGTQQAVTTTRLRRHLIGYRAMVDGVPVDGIALAIALHPRSRPFASGWSTTSSRRNSALRPPGMGHWIDCPTRRPSSALPTGARIEMLSGLPASCG